MGSISGKTHSINKTMEKAQDMASEWPQPSLMKQVQNFKIDHSRDINYKKWLGGVVSSPIERGCILAQGPLNTGAVNTVYPPPWLGKEGARYGESQIL